MADFFQGHLLIRNDINFLSDKFFILYDSFKCGNKEIAIKNGKALFCFSFHISDIFPEKRSKKEVDELAEKIQNILLFTEPKRNNYICPFEEIKNKLNYNLKLSRAKYFDNHIELIQYSYKYGLFYLDSIPKVLRKHIQYTLNTPKDVLDALKEP